MRFLVLEYPVEQAFFLNFTRIHPRSTADLIIEPAAKPSANQTAIVLLRNAPWVQIEARLERLQREHAPVHELRRDPKTMQWLGRITLHPGEFRDPGAKALSQVLKGLGSPWIHVESGVLHLRARIPEPVAPDLAERAEAVLRKAGIEAQAEIREFSPHDYSVWQQLIQQSVGLSS